MTGKQNNTGPTPTVSVLLPVFNGEKYIGEAVQSVLAQSYKDFDLYVIDDGSSDNTVSVLETIHDSRMHLIKNDGNKGLIATLNRGLALLQEKNYTYIIRMDADDISLSNRFEKQVAFMESNPDVGLCGSWVEEFKDSGTIKISRRSERNEKIQAELFFQNTIWHPSVIIRTEVLKRHNIVYEQQFLHAEDYAFWCRMSRVTKLANLPEVLLRYRVHATNVSVKYATVQRDTAVDINAMNLDYLIGNISGKLYREKANHLHDTFVRMLRQIPADAAKVTKTDILCLQEILEANRQSGTFAADDFHKAMSDFLLQYWTLWCRKYSPGIFVLLFVNARFLTKHWPLKRQAATAIKCLAGWQPNIA